MCCRYYTILCSVQRCTRQIGMSVAGVSLQPTSRQFGTRFDKQADFAGLEDVCYWVPKLQAGQQSQHAEFENGLKPGDVSRSYVIALWKLAFLVPEREPLS